MKDLNIDIFIKLFSLYIKFWPNSLLYIKVEKKNSRKVEYKSIKISKDLHKTIKVLCSEKELKINEFVEDSLYLKSS
jgi:hypothetical protein